MLDLKPNWVSVLNGINDVWRAFDCPQMPETHATLEQYRETCEAIIQKTLPNVKGMILMTPYYMEPNRNDAMCNEGDKGGVSTGGTLWMIDSGDEAKKQASFEFIKFCVNPENQAYWNSITGYFPINVNAQDTDIFKANIEKYPQFQTALDQLHASGPEYVGSMISVFPEVRQYVEDVTEKIFQQGLSAEDAVTEMVNLANNAIEMYNLTNY